MKKRDLSKLRIQEMQELEKRGTELALQASLEGSVLLENNGVLPLSPQAVALYGYGARKTMVSGIGSGDIAYRYVVNVEEGLENNGFTIVSKDWLDEFDRVYADYRTALLEDVEREAVETGIDNLHCLYNRPHVLPETQDITEENLAHANCDIAIYVITRKEGEGRDNRYAKGEYLPHDQEIKQLKQLRRAFSKLVVLLNIGSPIEMKEILDAKPDAVLLMYQGGAEIGNAVAKILSGQSCPSGKLTTTWAKDYWEYPNSAEFGDNDGDTEYERYKEGIYMGYRYFDTFHVEPLYPFGYGLSYTTFRTETIALHAKGGEVCLEVQVKNIGQYAGKEVVQLYAGAPFGKEDHPRQELVAFEKTSLLDPGETQKLIIRFRMEDLASFSEKISAYYLEKGDYILRIGNSSGNTKICGVIRMKEERILKQVKHLFERPVEFEELKAPERKLNTWEAAEISAAPIVEIDPNAIAAKGEIAYSGDHPNYFGGKISMDDVNTGSGEIVCLNVPENISLSQVKHGDYTVEEMVASMSEEELYHLVVGQEHIDPRFRIASVSKHVPGAAGESTNYFVDYKPEREIPYSVLADGPAGLRLTRHIQADPNGEITFIDPLLTYEGGEFVTGDGGYVDGYEDLYQYVTGLPISTQLANTWNKDLLRRIGRVISEEMEKYDVDLWLAPGLNLQRNPLCGRNFEYFSEDPYVSAAVSIALVQGAQSIQGRGATIKHLAANNQEAARTAHCSVVTERTMREMYLKGFELTTKYSNPTAMMTSLNCVNGPHGTNSKDIATYVVRDEWNYKGLIMTDWNTTTPARGGSTTACINAGDNLIMPGSTADIERLDAALHNLSGAGDVVTLGNLQNCAIHVLNYLLQTNRI